MKADENGNGSGWHRPLHILRPDDGDPRHGTRNGYANHMCRCPACRAAWAEYARELRKRKQEALGAA